MSHHHSEEGSISVRLDITQFILFANKTISLLYGQSKVDSLVNTRVDSVPI